MQTIQNQMQQINAFPESSFQYFNLLSMHLKTMFVVFFGKQYLYGLNNFLNNYSTCNDVSLKMEGLYQRPENLGHYNTDGYSLSTKSSNMWVSSSFKGAKCFIFHSSWLLFCIWYELETMFVIQFLSGDVCWNII